ncbi:sigma-70 family RNA polymerase sigma factor [Amycolatopsis sp. OK19-0408]|uniref:Sigma-70 family RNA polymerase sigma factor n=1 Tax=Amycolatopsis iheyensis TaxID=2945988 RepID=A0A9X2SH80_9PSEU|nr:sigma-70 family RNA polymerase sigma factor [Amycolatopsis iheyensis]
MAKTDHSRVAALFDAAREGDRAALDELVSLLTPLLWQVARDQGLDADQAADVVQTTWLRLLGSFAEIRSPVALTGWLITVTKREAWRAGEKRQVERPLPELPERLSEAVPAPEEGVLRDDQRARLWRAVDNLPERCRSLLRIVAFVHRPDYAEVGARLGMPRGSIGPTRGRCLARLREQLLANGEGDWL